MPHYGMVIDLKKCTGCQTCVLACKDENNIPSSNEKDRVNGRAISWLQLILMHEEGNIFIPVMCMHCKNAPCVKVCPVGATFKGNDGIVGQIYERCIGCRYCVAACPYNVKYFNWFKPKWQKGQEQRLNPDVTIRPKGVVEKCTFCHHKLQKIKDEKAINNETLKDGDYTTACAKACPSGAIVFGDLDDHQSRVSIAKHGKNEFVLLEELGTKPSVVYLK